MNAKHIILFSILLHCSISASSQSAELTSFYTNKMTAFNSGDLTTALSWSKKAEAKAKEEFGDNEMYANYASDLAQLYYQMENYKDAKALFEKVESIYATKLGQFHTYTAVINNNLGNLYRFLGDNNAALQAYKKALEGYRQNLGHKSEYYKMTLNSLIDLCNREKLYNDQEELYRAQRAFAAAEGTNSEEYLAWTNNLAMVIEHTGKVTESEALYKECLDIAQKNKTQFAEAIPTLNANLGEFYLKQNRLDDAEKFLQRSLEPAHESYATHLSNLAMVYNRKKDFPKSLTTYQKALGHLKAAGQDTSLTYRSVVYNIVSLYLDFGKYSESIALVKETLKSTGQNDPRLLNELGVLFERSGAYQRADSAYAIVLNQKKGERGYSKQEHNRALAARAEVWRIQGRLDDAEKTLVEALTELQKDSVEERESIATVHHNLAYLYKTMGQFAKAEAYFQKAIRQHERIKGQDHEYAGMVKNLGSLYMDMIQYERAEKLITQAMVIEKKLIGDRTDAYSTSLNQLGLALYYQGRYNESKKWIEQSLEIKEVVLGKQHEFYANGLVNLANIYMDEGAFELADPLYRQAERIYKNSSGVNTKNYANILHALAKSKIAIGFHAAGRDLLIQTLAVQAKVLGTSHPDYANAMNSLGMLYAEMNQFEKADSAYSISLELRKANGGDKSYSYAQTLNNIAQMYLFSGRAREAGQIYEQCLGIAENTIGKDHPDYATFLNNIGQAKFKTGDFEAAKNYLERAITRRQKLFGNSHPSTLEARSNLLATLEALGKSKDAEKTFQSLNEEYLNFILLKFPHLTEKEKTAFYSTINYHFESFQSFAVKHAKENPAIIGQMLDIQLATKALLLNDSKKVRETVMASGDEKIKTQYNTWLGKREYLAKLYSLSETEISSRGINLKKLETEADSLERELTRNSPLFASANKSAKTSWKDIRKNLKPGEAAVEMTRFYLFDKQWIDSLYYAALIVKNDSEVPEIVVLRDGKMLESRYLKYYKATIQGRVTDTRSLTHYWTPIQKHLTGVQKIYFAPDGVYNEINLNTLTDSAGVSLLDKLSIHVVTSTKELIGEKRASRAALKKSLLIGRPSYKLRSASTKANEGELRGDGTSARTGRWLQGASFSDLPGTQKEIEQIAGILRPSVPVETYLGEHAREEIIKKATDANILHIATHGFFIADKANEFDTYNRKEDNFADPMLRSGIVLAGVESFQHGNSIASEDDGILTALEVCNLKLENTELVVMSACETGLGEIRYGEGVYGLQRAFRIAGAKSMIMSLWKVDDQATQEMMVAFYNHWIKNGDKRKAFEAAQIEIRKRYKYPYYWGAFVLLGD